MHMEIFLFVTFHTKYLQRITLDINNDKNLFFISHWENKP